MKYLKMLCLAVGALALLSGTAVASTLTSPAGTTYTGGVNLVSEGGIKIKNESGLGEVTCDWSIEANTESHGAAVTAGGKVNKFLMTGCFPAISLSVLKTGRLAFHTDTEAANGNAVVTWDEFELTVNYPSLGISCTYSTGTGLNLGTLTGSKTTGSNATVDGSSPKVPRTGDSIFCGANATMTGSFKVSTPAYLDVD